jgi:hypothetical protein
VTITTDLRVALQGPLDTLLTEFGVTATLRRPATSRAADNTGVTITPAVGGAPSPTQLLIVSQKKVDVQKVFGQETDAELLAIVRDNVPVQMKDRFEITSGTSASSTVHYQVNEIEGVDAGGIWQLGLTLVPALPAS